MLHLLRRLFYNRHKNPFSHVIYNDGSWPTVVKLVDIQLRFMANHRKTHEHTTTVYGNRRKTHIHTRMVYGKRRKKYYLQRRFRRPSLKYLHLLQRRLLRRFKTDVKITI